MLPLSIFTLSLPFLNESTVTVVRQRPCELSYATLAHVIVEYRQSRSRPLPLTLDTYAEKNRKFSRDEFDSETIESLAHVTHVNG